MALGTTTTVTIFADDDPLTRGIAASARQHGASVHLVSVPAGWFRSTARAVVRLDSEAGLAAMRELCDAESTTAQVVAVALEPPSGELQEWCRTCADRHDMHLVPVTASDPAAVTQVLDSVFERHER